MEGSNPKEDHENAKGRKREIGAIGRDGRRSRHRLPLCSSSSSRFRLFVLS
jgi:hypothetical protein